jgi:serine protease AprX
VAALVIGLSAAVVEAAPRARLSRDLADALQAQRGEARDVILQADQATVTAVAARHGATIKKWLATGAVLSVSGASLDAMSNDAAVDHLSGDTMVRSMMAVTEPAIGADQVRAGTLAGLGSITGRGVGVALIDSGVFNHKALQGRIVASFDFTDGQGKGLDELGHGTHVAGIIGGNDGDFRGVAPGVSIVSLKVLGGDGSGRTSDVIRAIDFAIANKGRFGLRVINLSLGRPVFESFLDDPLDQAVERA